jgi:cellulose synthase/poly-beta-1,6-N-acetylglucosamine synthase-like glycosyltransferase
LFNWNQHIHTIETIVFISFLAFTLAQYYYWLRIYIPVILHKKAKEKTHAPISVVICAKNEGENLRKNLKKVLEQNHSNYEVIIVNDGSTDATEEVIGEYLSKYKNLKTTSIPPPTDPKFTHGKKLAITVGIKAAKNDWIVFTDADCWPETSNWLSSIQTGFDKSEIVLGYGGYASKKGLLNNFIRFETVNIALMYLGFALIKKPYMGVGRNLAYRKDLFFKNKGFANHYGLLSGDDDLFINETATTENTKVVTNKSSITRSEPETSWKNFFNQKVRHLSTANKYKSLHSFRIGMEPISRVWFYMLFIVLISNKIHWISALSVFVARTLIQLWTYIKVSQKFNEKKLWLSFIIFDVYSLFFNFLAYFALLFRRKIIQWK